MGVPTFELSTGESGQGTYDYRCWVEVTINPLINAGGYIIQFKENTETVWRFMQTSQPASGNVVIKTYDLRQNTLYNFRVCAVSKLGGQGNWSEIQNITTTSNIIAYPVPTGIEATAILDGVLVTWDNLS